jgi:hypothetical protein
MSPIRFFFSPLLLAGTLATVSLSSCATGIAEMYYGSPALPLNAQGPVHLADRTDADINGAGKNSLFLKTPTQTFCKGWAFMLVDGKIYYASQSVGQGTGKTKTPNWKLLTATGLPHSRMPGFTAPRRIVEISADGDTLFALSDEGRMYQCYFAHTTVTRPLTWIDAFGWPDKLPLVLNDIVLDNRAWAVGTRRKDVLWYEDINGNQHHYGTMGIETIYFLTKDGQEIRYADTGLPSDFSHGILGPERGSFIARSLGASASTLFVIGEKGEMYTRLADFDTLGNDPMFFKYTYRRESWPVSGSDYRSNFTPWALPAEDWKKEPSIQLSGKARITSCITILQTGQGNFARELRVAGLSEGGATGYYFKKISGVSWSFRKCPLVLDESKFLGAGAAAEAGAGASTATRGQKKEFAYSGSMWNNGVREAELSFSIPDFPMSEGSCHLVVKYRDEERTIKLFPVETWTYMTRYDPGLDGMPKYFFLTVSAPRAILTGTSPDFSRLLENYFGSRDLELFSCRAEVTDSYFQLEFGRSGMGTDESEGTSVFMTRVGVPEIDFRLLRKTVSPENPIVRQYLDEKLIVRNGERISPERRAEIAAALDENKKYRDLLERDMNRYQTYRRVAGLSRLGYGVFDLVTTVTMLDKLEFPKFKTATSYSGDIMDTATKGYILMAESREWSYPQIHELLDERIAAYGKVLAELDAGAEEAKLNPHLRNTFPEYLSLIGIPDSLDGSSPSNGNAEANVQQLTTSPLFPGLVFESDGTRVLVEMKGAAGEIAGRQELDLSRKPFRTRVAFHSVSGKENANRGSIEWDGATLTIRENVSLFSDKILFIGRRR